MTDEQQPDGYFSGNGITYGNNEVRIGNGSATVNCLLPVANDAAVTDLSQTVGTETARSLVDELAGNFARARLLPPAKPGLDMVAEFALHHGQNDQNSPIPTEMTLPAAVRYVINGDGTITVKTIALGALPIRTVPGQETHFIRQSLSHSRLEVDATGRVLFVSPYQTIKHDRQSFTGQMRKLAEYDSIAIPPRTVSLPSTKG